MRKKTLILAVLLVMAFLPAVHISQGAWLPDYEYYKQITFSNSDFVEGDLLNFNITYANAESKCQSDFDDLRFTDMADQLLDAWAEQKSNGNFVEVWLESNGELNIKMYYGNPSASSYWNMSAVFDVYDVSSEMSFIRLDEGTGEPTMDGSETGTLERTGDADWNSTGRWEGVAGMEFFGDDDAVSTQAGQLLDYVGLTNGTLSFWAYSDLEAGEHCIFNWYSGWDDMFIIILDTNEVNVRVVDDTVQTNYVLSLPDYDADEWFHVSVVQNGTHLLSYFNGSLTDTEATSDWFHSTGVGVGLPLQLGDIIIYSSWDGVMNDIYLFDEILTAEKAGRMGTWFPDWDLSSGDILMRSLTDVPTLTFGDEQWGVTDTGDLARRGETLGAVLIGGFILIPILILAVGAMRRR